MKLYWKHPHEEENVEVFKRFMRANDDVTFYKPAPMTAPWHVQAKVNGVLINFWPHRMKGQRDGDKSRTGYSAMQRLIDDAKSHVDFNVID